MDLFCALPGPRVLESGLVWDPLLKTKSTGGKEYGNLDSIYHSSYPSNASCTADHGAICIGDAEGNCPDIIIRFRSGTQAYA